MGTILTRPVLIPVTGSPAFGIHDVLFGGGPVVYPPDPTYPTVTGTQELKLESDALTGSHGSQVTSWIDDWRSVEFTIVGTDSITKSDNSFADESAVLYDGPQTDSLSGDRGTVLGDSPGIEWFFVIETGALSVAPNQSFNILSGRQGASSSRYMIVGRRSDAGGNFLSWWDGTWRDTTTVLADNTKYIIGISSDNTDMKFFVNGDAGESVGNPVHQNNEIYDLGNNYTFVDDWLGKIAAIIFYRSQLSDAHRILVRDYLNEKYVVY